MASGAVQTMAPATTALFGVRCRVSTRRQLRQAQRADGDRDRKMRNVDPLEVNQN